MDKELLSMIAGLQKKKNALRKDLAERGVQKREGKNDFDRYTYFSEAQYKALFTELFSKHGLELKFDELEYQTFEGSEKQANGRMPRIQFELFDIDTGYSETTTITGEGIDKGDKAGYKAYTGALKYYLANTFLVATGDDPEKESPDTKMNTKKPTAKSTTSTKKATEKQLEILRQAFTPEQIEKMLGANGIEKLEDISIAKASEYISELAKRKEQKNA